MSRIGDPATRPEEDFFFVPMSFDLEQEIKEWETSAIVVKAMSAPATTGVPEIEALILHEMHLQRGEVSVSRHQLEPFLIKFTERRHAEAACRRSCLKHRGVVINVRPWRSLAAVLGMAALYRVRLCLEGVPVHAWRPEIIERLIGPTCSLEYIETNLVQPDDTRMVDLWAWSPNPSKIPKKMWLVFTPRTNEVVVMATPPEHWQQGIRYCVFVHLEWIYD